MGQVLRADKIGALSESGGTITLQPSILTIGGQQYETTSNTNVALPSMTANTRYQVFAIQTAGVVSLVISQNENSQGPAGSDSWKLVGSFLTDHLSAFNEFLLINAAPKRKEYVDMTGAGDFTGGVLIVEKTGNIVTLGVEAQLTHPSLQNPVSTIAVIPDWGRPVTTEVHTTYKYFGSSGDSIRVTNGGNVNFAYRNSSLAGANRTGTGAFSISYFVQSTNTIAIEDL